MLRNLSAARSILVCICFIKTHTKYLANNYFSKIFAQYVVNHLIPITDVPIWMKFGAISLISSQNNITSDIFIELLGVAIYTVIINNLHVGIYYF